MSAVVFISMIIVLSDLLKLLVGVPLGIGFYLLSAYLIRINELEEVYGMTKPFIKRISCIREV